MPPLGKDLSPPFKLSGMVTFLTIPSHWNTCSDDSAIPEHGEWRSKNTQAQYSSSIESKYKFEYKYGLRSDLRGPPDPPSACVLAHAPSSVPPQHCKNIWVTLTIFWSSQLHAYCVRDTLQNFKGGYHSHSESECS